MELYEYEYIAKDNGIEVPRLRGYYLMKNEDPASKENVAEIMKYCEVSICEDLCRSTPFWSPDASASEYSLKTDRIVNYYLTTETDDEGFEKYVGIRWDRIHGWKRKILKYEIKKQNRTIKKQFSIWNRYAGREDVLCIRSRLGGSNWEYFNGYELEKKDWFLEKVDDYFDSTYCDIYALVK